MIKMLVLLKRRADVPLADFLRYYEETHAPLFARLIPADVAEAITYYAQNHPVAIGDGGHAPPYDCVTEFGFADLAGLQRWTTWYRGAAGAPLRADEERFMDTAQRVVVITEEHRIPHR
jgi:uncharacterized protein (TIGR02118 family)